MNGPEDWILRYKLELAFTCLLHIRMLTSAQAKKHVIVVLLVHPYAEDDDRDITGLSHVGDVSGCGR